MGFPTQRSLHCCCHLLLSWLLCLGVLPRVTLQERPTATSNDDIHLAIGARSAATFVGSPSPAEHVAEDAENEESERGAVKAQDGPVGSNKPQTSGAVNGDAGPSLEYSKTDEVLDKLGLTANSIYARADKKLDAAADKALEKSHLSGKQVSDELIRVNGYRDSMTLFRKRLKTLHDVEMGEVKTDMERATAPRIREGNRPPSATQVHNDEGDDGDNETATVAHTEAEYDGQYEDGQDGEDEDNHTSSLVQVGSSSKQLVQHQSSQDNRNQHGWDDEDDEEFDEDDDNEYDEDEQSGESEMDRREDEMDDEDPPEHGGEHDSESEVEDSEASKLGNNEPIALSYPNYTNYGELYIKRFDDMHHRITNHLDELAHNADMKSRKYGYGLDGIRNSVRSLKDSTRDIYKEKVRKNFKEQVNSFSTKLEKDQPDIYDKDGGKQHYPDGFWHTGMNANGDKRLFPDGSPAPAAIPDWAINAGDATGRTPQEVMHKLGHFGSSALLETQAENVPIIPYKHFKAYSKAVEASSKRISNAIDLMTSKLPDAQKKSQEYKHKNFVLQQSVHKLGEKVLPKFFKKIHDEKKKEVNEINMLDLSEVFTDRHKQVLKEATQDDMNFIKKGKFKDRPKIDFGKNPYDDMSNQQWEGGA